MAVIIFWALPGTAQNDMPLQEGIHFRWAFGAIKHTPQGLRFEIICRDTSLKSGDRIKFFIQRQSRCHVYLFHRNTRGEISLLFPYRFDTSPDRPDVSAPFYIPAGNRWFELDEHEGLERFYLLASTRRLVSLEDLVNRYEGANGTRKMQLSKQVIDKIHKLRKQNMKFKTQAERPLAVTGTMRGTETTADTGRFHSGRHRRRTPVFLVIPRCF